ncbi:uncharacterized protein Z518_10909 [Rhinocladiella mackenziei CBS 650.93]|uniref:Rhinocladiella mackenziei CBS 650.93 unplaced genomic scaffold supercont1.10, whole genome shotgun sequence n=1 Tax=Rhinocladiella mackenziei CBS 650.93 TaxID=1442369 RepID=A0A0D2FD23_9EURO|nr:uncharacterized protein Z518_10909 [Rhinocladiella mackenziei CBS 650.93]KIW99981.1 hypothetical protein Z518_10909 [Rhinocladiella mackenziei CBS 650.93]
MDSSKSFSAFALSLFTLFFNVAAQSGLHQQVLSTFIYTRYGDRTPLVLPDSPTLTPLGAQQLYAAGEQIRERYLAPLFSGDNQTTTIYDISQYQLVWDQLTIMSTDDQYVSASAQAFLQGLYPPLEEGSNYTYIEGQSTIQNGSNLVAPLEGYQYPNIITMTSNDLNSIWINGMYDCPAYTSSSNDYYETEAFQSIQNNTADFYASLQPDFLDGIFADASVGYFDAYFIYDYLEYASIHNTTVAEKLSPEDLTKAKILAADWVFALNADTSVSGSTAGDHIRAVAGRTLATRVLQAFYTNINTQGSSDKMTLLFGSFEPMVAFAALADLISPQNAAFYNVPGPGSSFIFELYAMQSESLETYPDVSEMFVRFYYQNGTGDDSSLVAYPLFGLSPSQTMISLADFIAGLEGFMMSNVEDWCTTCNSFSVFCPAFVDTDGSLTPTPGVSSSRKGLSPVVAGVIGAVVTLAVAALLFGALMLFAGLRMHRVHTKRRSELGGFKGAEKLASDQDLTIPKGGAGAVVVASGDPVPVRGHERVGSWELKDQAKAEEAQGQALSAGDMKPRRPSYEDDDIPISPYTPPVDTRNHV